MPSSVTELEALKDKDKDKDRHAGGLHLLTPVTIHPNYEAKELTIKNYHFWVLEHSKEGDISTKTCKPFSLSGQLKLMNSTYLHLYNTIQKRKAEAQRFLDKYSTEAIWSANATAIGAASATNLSATTSYFYAVEALPKPAVIFRLVHSSGSGSSGGRTQFEAFDVVPNTFRLQSRGGGRLGGTADVYVYLLPGRDAPPSSPPERTADTSRGGVGTVEVRTVTTTVDGILPFVIFGDKSHQLVATFPVRNYSYFWDD